MILYHTRCVVECGATGPTFNVAGAKENKKHKITNYYENKDVIMKQI